MILLYNALLLVALAALLPALVLFVLLTPRLRHGFGQRLLPLPRGHQDTVWLHAASVGEVEAAAPIADALINAGTNVVATALSDTGLERLRTRFPRLGSRLLPLDLPGLTQLSLWRARVRVLVLVETELWPNLLWAARGRRCPTLLVSARISDAAWPRYQRLRPLFAPLLRETHVLARSEQDRERFVALGAIPARSEVGGDLKLDRAPPGPVAPELRGAVGDGPFLLGASTHAGEEEALFDAWCELQKHSDTAPRLLLAPRHPERVAAVCAALRARGADPGLRSEGAADRDVVILDTLGELPQLYALAGLVFAGGTLAEVGGHNLVEAVQAGKRLVHGPHTQNQRSQLELLQPLGVLCPVADARELTRSVQKLWGDPDRDAPAQAAARVLESHRGAARAAVDRILRLAERGRRA